jgi:hypothetical protein
MKAIRRVMATTGIVSFFSTNDDDDLMATATTDPKDAHGDRVEAF